MRIFLYTLLSRLIHAYYLVLVAHALMSWFPGVRQSKLARVISGLAEPFLEPLRRLGLHFGGLDFSVIVAIFILNMLQRMLWSVFF